MNPFFDKNPFFNALNDFFQGPIPKEKHDFPVYTKDLPSYYLIEAELPGFNKEDINLEVIEKKLYITAKKRQRSQSLNHSQKKKLKRSIEVPYPIYQKYMKATFHNGLLTIKVPKKKRKIDIN